MVYLFYMKKYYTIKQAAELLGVSDDTLRRWEAEGKIKPVRTKGNHRRYADDDLNRIRLTMPCLAEYDAIAIKRSRS